MDKRFIYEQPWTDVGKINEADFSRLYLSRPTNIGPAITFMMGKDNISLNPLTMMTEGRAQYMTPLNGLDYEYDVISSLSKTVALAESVTTGKPGYGFSTFILKFKDKHFARDYSILSPNQYILRIVKDPVQDGSLWAYEVAYVGTGDPEGYVPLSELTEGTFFTRGWANVANFDSVGNDSDITAPAKVRGNIGVLRKSFKWAGNIPNKVMTVEFLGNKMFWSFQQYQIEKQWQQEKENYYWYSLSSRSDDGSFNHRDSQLNPLIMGDGLLAQIGNKDTYGVLTYSKLNQVIRDAYTGMKDAQNKTITLFTGIGGAQFFDEAIKSGALGNGFTMVSGDKFIEGSGANLRFTGYFVEYHHRDGFTVKVQTVDLFDFGQVAMNSPIHPKTGLPMESHRLVFLDTSNYDGGPNIMGMYEKGRQFSRTAVLGVGPIPHGFPDTPNRSSDRDASSIHYMQSGGVVMRRFNTSIDLRCVLS